jgi:hypothetical protein
MKKLLYPLLMLTLLSCGPKQKPMSAAELKAGYLQSALKSDAYKNAFMNVKRVNDALDSVKKGKLDTVVPIFEYNNSIATATAQVKTIAQVTEAMKKDTAYLKSVQLKAAADSALADKRNIDFSK